MMQEVDAKQNGDFFSRRKTKHKTDFHISAKQKECVRKSCWCLDGFDGPAGPGSARSNVSFDSLCCCLLFILHNTSALSLSVSLLSALTVAEFPSKGFSVTFEDHNF